MKVHLFAKAKELAGGSSYITCRYDQTQENVGDLTTSRLEGSSILCRDFLENHVFEVF